MPVGLGRADWRPQIHRQAHRLGWHPTSCGILDHSTWRRQVGDPCMKLKLGSGAPSACQKAKTRLQVGSKDDRSGIAHTRKGPGTTRFQAIFRSLSIHVASFLQSPPHMPRGQRAENPLPLPPTHSLSSNGESHDKCPCASAQKQILVLSKDPAPRHRGQKTSEHRAASKFPVLIDRFDGPVELFP